MTALTSDILAYGRMRAELEASHKGEWVVFHDGQLVDCYADFETAAERAVELFDEGPYLIRQIGAPPVQLPGGMVFTPAHALGAGRL